jgi:hypothetical protein
MPKINQFTVGYMYNNAVASAVVDSVRESIAALLKLEASGQVEIHKTTKRILANIEQLISEERG